MVSFFLDSGTTTQESPPMRVLYAGVIGGGPPHRCPKLHREPGPRPVQCKARGRSQNDVFGSRAHPTLPITNQRDLVKSSHPNGGSLGSCGTSKEKQTLRETSKNIFEKIFQKFSKNFEKNAAPPGRHQKMFVYVIFLVYTFLTRSRYAIGIFSRQIFVIFS